MNIYVFHVGLDLCVFVFSRLCSSGESSQSKAINVSILQMGLVVTKPVFRVSDKVRLKPVSSATETSWKIGISLVASLDITFTN